MARFVEPVVSIFTFGATIFWLLYHCHRSVADLFGGLGPLVGLALIALTTLAHIVHSLEQQGRLGR